MMPANQPLDPSARRKVFVTGAGGDIGTGFIEQFHQKYDFTQFDLPGVLGADRANLGDVIDGDLSDISALKESLQGVHTVIHLAGKRKANTVWRDLLETNIIGTYNLVAAAIAAGCKKIIYASSVHAVSGYPLGRQVRESDPVNPGDLYGVSKVFGEALGRLVANEQDMAFIPLRIGAFQEPDVAQQDDSQWLLLEYTAPADLFQLMDKCIVDDQITYEIFNATSSNRISRLDMSKAQELLGFDSEFDSFDLVPGVAHTFPTVAQISVHNESGMRQELEVPQ